MYQKVADGKLSYHQDIWQGRLPEKIDLVKRAKWALKSAPTQYMYGQMLLVADRFILVVFFGNYNSSLKHTISPVCSNVFFLLSFAKDGKKFILERKCFALDWLGLF